MLSPSCLRSARQTFEHLFRQATVCNGSTVWRSFWSITRYHIFTRNILVNSPDPHGHSPLRWCPTLLAGETTEEWFTNISAKTWRKATRSCTGEKSIGSYNECSPTLMAWILNTKCESEHTIKEFACLINYRVTLSSGCSVLLLLLLCMESMHPTTSTSK